MNPCELERWLDRYLALRAALGLSSKGKVPRLRAFVRFVQERDLSTISTETVVDWACSSKSGPAGRSQRLCMVRGFLGFLSAAYPVAVVPGRGLVARYRRQKPYVYSEEEIAKLHDAALGLRPHGLGGLRPHTYATLLGLLVSTGLRGGEARRLTIGDVRLDEDPPLLLVRETKFRKTRLVPIQSSTAEMLRAYADRRSRAAPMSPDEPFFISRPGYKSTRPYRRLNRDAVNDTFRTLWKRTGIQRLPDGRRPTVHGFRHVFAIRRMESWQREGVDVRAWLPHLAVYMGHVNPSGTYWYLTATPELLDVASKRFEVYAAEGGAR